jgi:Fic family protein
MVVLDVPAGEWVRIIRAEYEEMPGLTLTRKQIERLWGLDDRLCDEVLAELLARGFLVRHPDGNYARPHEQF